MSLPQIVIANFCVSAISMALVGFLAYMAGRERGLEEGRGIEPEECEECLRVSALIGPLESRLGEIEAERDGATRAMTDALDGYEAQLTRARRLSSDLAYFWELAENRGILAINQDPDGIVNALRHQLERGDAAESVGYEKGHADGKRIGVAQVALKVQAATESIRSIAEALESLRIREGF